VNAILPPRIKRDSGRKQAGKRSPAHRAWVRGHCCMACGSSAGIECAHVRVGTDGAMGLKPSDRWTVPLCRDCHARQHQIGEDAFEKQWGINLKAVAEALFRHSPHRKKLEVPNG
jgi:hypothetical protein